MSNLQDIIEEVLGICKPQFKVRDIEKVTHYPSNLPLIPVDQDRIKQVLLNIISNAITAMAVCENRTLNITVNNITSKGSVQIIISDTGPGIDEKHLSKVFDPFFTTKEQGEGVGLGLYICYGIVNEHGGQIRVENNEEGGASFIIELPTEKEVVT
jgi:two-component system NtrC family sensor kinase